MEIGPIALDIDTLKSALNIFGWGPFVILYLYSFIRTLKRSPFQEDTLLIENEIPWRYIGESNIELITDTPILKHKIISEPLFKTLRVDVEQIQKARWRFRVKFLFYNSMSKQIVIDDMHTLLYERKVPTPAYATISYRGEVSMLQDNCIWKENQSYSLYNKDGYEIVLVLEMTRLEGAPLYGSDSDTEGPVRTIFGLLVDYYILNGEEIERKSVPSDCIYLFECQDKNSECQLRAIDSNELDKMKIRHINDDKMQKVIQHIEGIYIKHSSFRPTPRT